MIRGEVPDGFVAVGRVLGPWGVRGDLKIEPLADLDRFRSGLTVQLAGSTCIIERVNTSGRQLRLKLIEINDRETATAHRGQYLILAEADLGPAGEDRYYRFQLIGLNVVSTDGDPIGEITDIFATGSNDIFVVKGPRGELLIPAIDDVVQSIDLDAKVV
ncbi:MAG: ribosome maturation factor RimM, partial [Dehalococcoidia bacterium]